MGAIDIEYGEDAALEKLLRSIDRPSDLCAHGRLFAPMPRLEVDGAGMLSFPVPEAQVRALIAAAEPAPYGKGPDTLIDASVRDCRQIGAERIRLAGGAWPDTFARILDAAASGLGCAGDRLDAQLYKLLVYERGGFFAAHRDTEKAHGMIATLSISLPVAGGGGELVVRHHGREVVVDMNVEEPSELAFAAFYADCTHEIRPVVAGHRLSLVFNLCLRPDDRSSPRKPPDFSEQIDAIARRLVAWRDDEFAAEKLVWLLDHEYSEAGLSFDTLKNADAARAQALAAAAERADCELHAAILHIEEHGDAMYRGDYVDGWGWNEGNVDQMEIGELFDSHHRLDGWASRDGARPQLGELKLEDGELLPRGALDHAVPDEQRLHEATGNEGVSLERAYRHAALVLWPRSRTLAILAGAGIGGAVAALPRLATPDRTLPAALRELHGERGLADTVPFATLWRHATGFLLGRSASPPKEPRHWKIAADVDCDCNLCADLRAFCNDPAARVARFPLRKDLRAHLHRIIDHHRLDIDHETERRGRPYTLVCTKNRASHRRRLAEYAKDVSWMRRLIRSAPAGAQAARCAPDLARLHEAAAASERS